MNIRTNSETHYRLRAISRRGSVWLACHAGVLLCPAFAHALIEVQVRGTSDLEGSIDLTADPSNLRLHGRLSDELGSPVVGERLRVSFLDQSQTALPIKIAAECSLADARLASVGSGQDKNSNGEIVTRSDGNYCAILSRDALPKGALLRVSFAGSEGYVGAELQLDPTDLRRTLQGAVTGLPRRISLDDASATFSLTVSPVGDAPKGNSTSIALSLFVRDDLEIERERLVQTFPLKLAVSTPVTLASGDWGKPGPGELRVRFAGNETLRPTLIAQKILRTTVVTLSITDIPAQVVAGDTLSIHCQARSRFGPVSTGAVELMLNDRPLQVVTLSNLGAATVVVATPRTKSPITLTLRYVPTDEGFLPGPETVHAVELVNASPLRYVGWAVAGLLVLIWFALSRRQAPKVEPEQRTIIAQPPRAHVELLGPPSRGNVGWIGLVVDAHEGHALVSAQVAVLMQGFGQSTLLFETSSDREGAFSIPPGLIQPGTTCELAVRTLGYAAFKTELPPPGQLKVHLVSVRRALLDRLVEWTKRRGVPFRSKAEATPDWVAQVARLRGHQDIERWANAVSSAAFGRAQPEDAQAPELQPPSGPQVTNPALKQSES